MIPLFIYLVIINALALILMLVDKKKAIRDAYRIPERVLLGVAAIGGSLGAIVGMRCFRHKTRHLQFSLGLPAMLIVHLALLYTVLFIW